ncbi:MAG: GerMN domain-containing protein [bacterium]
MTFSKKIFSKWLILVSLVILFGVASFTYFFYFAPYPVSDNTLGGEKKPLIQANENWSQFPSLTETTKKELEFYFPSRGSTARFGLEKKEILVPANTVNQIKYLINEMMKGPQSTFLCSIIPKGTEIRQVFLDTANNVAYLDFNSSLKKLNIDGGIYTEQSIIYSIVDTVCKNFDQIKKVKFLIEGEEVMTLGGHLYTGDFIEPDINLFFISSF